MAGGNKTFTVDEVSRHNTPEDYWCLVNGDVYDLSDFLDVHPGGRYVLLQYAGRDATEVFFSLHRSDVLKKYKRLKIGSVEGAKPEYVVPEAGSLSVVPAGEPAWLDPGFKSPYYDDSHRALQKKMRFFFDTYVKAEAKEGELTHTRPSLELYELMGKPEWEINAMRMGPGRHLKERCGDRKLPGGVDPEKFNYFHELVVVQELVRIGAPGWMAGLQAGMVIGLPPVLNFGSDDLRKEILPDILDGKKFICLAISEAFAGSDVQGMQTRARKSEDGQHWIVTGTKKWITQGHYADYFMTGVRTSDKGLSMMLIPRSEAVETKIIKTSYSSAAGTAYVTFNEAKVPVRYLLGKENEGLKVILSNFNHERWVICCRIARYSRLIYEELFKWAHLRESAGKKLIENAVIRQKLASCYARVEAGQAFLEALTFQMTQMSYADQSKRLAGPMALLKYRLSKDAWDISDMGVQIFGGRGITSTGMGIYIEQHKRTTKFDSILGGSEEVLADLAVRQASKNMPKAVL